ncbi:hypothetical protein TNCV_2748991 [Trichonephila clavipes]|nr:hypothetical protein TNCV_2748991 [Trichonephila clavipes]
MYQEADLGDYINFMMNFWTVLIRLKPSEVIEIKKICAMNIIDLMMEILPYHEPHDVPWFESFPISNLPTWIANTWSKRLPKGKAPLSKPYGLNMPYPNCTVWCTWLGDAMVLKT